MAGVQASARLPNLTKKMSQTMNQQYQHSRRSPPRDVMLLAGHKKQKLSHSPDDAVANASPGAHLKRQGSGSDQSASRWFDRVNEHVPQSAQVNTEYYDEPPFFMSNQTSYRPNTFAPSEGSRLFGVQSRLDSENEELRGVIDDLTVENKRLKTILRTNQNSQRGSPSTDGQDKLFEVRMHGLSSEKRRELEFLLKNFATSVHTSAPSISGSTAGSGVSSTGVTANNKSKADSGYASNSNSGHPSTFGAINTRGLPGVSKSMREKNIKSYLHDIPDTLLPRQQPMIMSERSKMALVVRRLEQLFTGKLAVPGEYSQSLQQQEVSHMAARADAKNSKKRKAEGTREAHILPPDTKVNLDVIETGSKKKQPELRTAESDSTASDVLVSSTSHPSSPDQRPTRPLDLDIHRAQVANENIQYIRHLGLSSPRLDAVDANGSWIYLNLLFNMAQLHTINVTPEFVRRAIKKVSTQFELSKDGHKVRWSGGSEGTVFSREEEKALEAADKDHNSPDELNEDSGTGGSSKRSKTDSNSNPIVSASTMSEGKTSGLHTSSASRNQISTGATSNLLSRRNNAARTPSAFDYKPIVYRDRARETIVEESYLQDSESSPDSASGDSSGLAHALSRSNLNQQRKADEGLITFYNNPFFCSDYSGDKMPNNMLPPRPVSPALIIGGPPGNDWDEHSSRLADACYFTPQFGPAPFRAQKDEKLPDLTIAPFSSAPHKEIRPKEFTVSGLGGMTPEDNFAIDVNVHMVRVSEGNSVPSIRTIPHTGTHVKPDFIYKRGACHKLQLLPSRLPPPSYIFFTSSSSSGNQIDDDDDDDDLSEDSSESSSSADDVEPAPPSFLQRWETEDSGQMDLEGIDDQDDSSMDMLAAARAADPIQIAEQERQYLINQPGGRAVAGSLAATVGASRTTSIGDDFESDYPEVASQAEEEDDDYDSDESDMDVDDDE